MKTGHIIAAILIGLGAADLVLGQSSTPIPVVGDYLTPTLDFVLIGGGLAVWVYF